jgi:hypothetical protein
VAVGAVDGRMLQKMGHHIHPTLLCGPMQRQLPLAIWFTRICAFLHQQRR